MTQKSHRIAYSLLHQVGCWLPLTNRRRREGPVESLWADSPREESIQQQARREARLAVAHQ
jgi:hypothetical protein